MSKMSQSRHRLASAGLLILLVIGCTALLTGGAFASGDGVEVNVSVDDTRVDVGETVDFEVIVENVDSVGAYALEVGISNTDTTALLDIESAGDPLYETDEPVMDGEAAVLDVVYGDQALSSNGDEIIVATGTFEIIDEGTSDIKVTIRALGNEDGASYDIDELTDEVRINSEPLTASFDVNPAVPTEGETVTLDASASTPDEITYQWNSTDDPTINSTTGDSELTHVFDEAGEYEVTLTVIEPDGTTDTATKTIDVESPYLYEPLPTQPGTELWNFTAEGSVVAAPTVIDGVAYIGSYGTQFSTTEGYVYAVDTTDGSELWRFTDAGGPVGDAPTVANDTVYFGSDDDKLYAVDSADGTEIWNVTTDGSVTSPTVDNGVVYAASRDDHIYAVYADNGTEKWNVSTERQFRNTAPAVVDDTVYIGNYDGKIFALDAETGTEQWNYTTDSIVTSVPTVVDETVYVGSWDDHLYALNATDGEKEWQFETGNLISSSPTVANGTVFLGGYDDTLYAIDPETGEETWSTTTHGSVTSPTVMGGIVYVGSYDGNANTGAVHGIDAEDGTIVWTFETDHEVRSAPTVVDGVVYVGSNDNNLYALRAAPAGSSNDSRVLQQTMGHHEYDTVVPSFAFDPMPPRPDEQFTVDGKYSTVTNDEIVEYGWDLSGDGTVDETTTNSDASHSFGETGSYDVTLTVEAESGHTAQTTRTIPVHENGTLTGTVTDPSGESSIDGATVQLLNGDDVVAVSETDADGAYELEARAGVYQLRADANGYGAVTLSGVEIDVDGQETTQSVALQTDTWQFTTDERVFSSPTVVDSIAYVGSDDDTIYAIDTETETELWSFETDGSVRSSPAVVDGTVYFGSYDENVYALNATDGTEEWRFETGGGVFSSPSVANGIVVAGSNDANLYALDAEAGTELWRFQTDGDRVSPSPTVDNGTVYVGSHGFDFYDSTYTENWYTIDLETGVEQWHHTIDGLDWYSESSATVADGTVYVGSYNGDVYALDADDGSKRWEYSTDNWIYSSPTVADGTVYVGSYDDDVYALDSADGTEIWSYTTGDSIYSSPTVADGTVYLGSFDGKVYALDAADGTNLWNYETEDSIFSSPTVADGTVYIGSDDGNLYALRAGVSASSVDSRVQLGTLGHITGEHEDDADEDGTAEDGTDEDDAGDDDTAEDGTGDDDTAEDGADEDDESTSSPTPSPSPSPDSDDSDGDISVELIDNGVAVSVADAIANESASIPLAGQTSTDAVNFTTLNIMPAADADFDVKVETSDELPSDVDELPATSEVLHTFDVDSSLTSEEIQNATFEFVVSADELEDRDLDPEDVKLYHYVEGEWVDRETTVYFPGDHWEEVETAEDLFPGDHWKEAGVDDPDVLFPEETIEEAETAEDLFPGDHWEEAETPEDLFPGDHWKEAGVENPDVLFPGDTWEVAEEPEDLFPGDTWDVTYRAETPHFSAFALVGDRPDIVVADRTVSTLEVTVGEEVIVETTVRNDGSAAGDVDIDLEVDGIVEETETVSVGPGENRSVAFTLSFENPGEFDVTLDGNAVDVVTVVDPADEGNGPADESGEDGPADPPDEEDPADLPDEDDSGGESTDETQDDETGSDISVYAIVAAVIVLLVVIVSRVVGRSD